MWLFSPDDVWYPFIRYECNIDISDAPAVSCCNMNYVPRESKTTENVSAAFVKIAHIYEMNHNPWMSKALFTYAPHQ